MRIIFILLSAVLLGMSSCSSCQRAKEIEERRAALAQHDVEELEQARKDLYEADSISSFLQFEVQDMKDTLVVFEKNEKYQSKGFYVLKDQAGDKSKLSFFAEVEEEGKLLLVSIGKDRKWQFKQIKPILSDFKKALSEKDIVDFVGRNLTDEEIAQVALLSQFSYKMNKLNDALASKEKNKMKIEFYEKKMK